MKKSSDRSLRLREHLSKAKLPRAGGATLDQYIRKLNAQHGSIREWDLGNGERASTDATGSSGFRLLK